MQGREEYFYGQKRPEPPFGDSGRDCYQGKGDGSINRSNQKPLMSASVIFLVARVRLSTF